MPYAPDLSGVVLDDRYELHALIGDGAFGRVYGGRDRRLAREVAIKVIKPWWADDPEWARSLEREAQLLARVSDPGIVQIFDTGNAPEGLYYVAELVHGESLASRIARERISPVQARKLAEQICRALGHAHACGVVHRDVKPANVLISDEGHVKVGDFGLARLAEGSSDGEAGAIAGTPRYMSPEQARGQPATPASDVYSVGVVLYEMLAGKPPFAGGSPVELAWRHTHEQPAALPAGTPRDLGEIVKRALAKDPRGRFQNAHEMADDLARAHVPPFRPEQRPRPREGDTTRVAPRFASRRNVNPAARRRSIAALGLVLGLLFAMVVAAIVLAAPARVRMPRLHGLSKNAVTAKLRRAHLKPSFTRANNPAKPGTTIEQTPAAGALVDEDSTVSVVLSKGPPPVEVPRLVGQSSGSARTILGSLGLIASTRTVPAPGVQPGQVTSQSPAGGYVSRHAMVVLSVAETPRWRPVTYFTGTSSVPFRIRAKQWRVVYRMSFVGTCTLIFFCDGPTGHVLHGGGGGSVADFGMNDGDTQTQTFQTGPGVYQVTVSPGSDTTRWSFEVDDYY